MKALFLAPFFSMPIKITISSDFHGKLPSIPSCDLLIIAGDITPGASLIKQAYFLETTFREYLEKVNASDVVFIAGNHDSIFQKAPHLVPKDLKATYLQDSFTEKFGLKIYGTPWQLPFYGAFNATEPSLKDIYARIPSCDILISHGPAYSLLDAIKQTPYDPDCELLYETIHVGSRALKEKIISITPKLVVTGHVHEAYGKTSLGSTLIVNGSYLDENMRPTHDPITIEL